MLLTAGLLIGNRIYGNLLSKKIEEQIKEQVDKHFELAGQRVDVKFDKVNVNPLFSKIKVNGLAVNTKDGRELVRSKQIELNMSYSELMRLLKSKKNDEIRSFRIKLNEFAVYVKEADDQLLINDLTLDFKGRLTQKMIKNINSAFPDEKQAVKLLVENMSFAEASRMHTLGFTTAQIARFNQIDKLSMDFTFNPDKKVLVLDDLQVYSPLISYKSKGHISYSGDGIDGMTPTQFASSIDLKLDNKGVTWGDPKLTGRYSLNKLLVQMDGIVDYKEGVQIIKSQNSKILMEDFKLEYAGSKKAQMEAKTALLGIKMDELAVERLAIQSTLKDGRLSIKDTELKSSFFDADFNAIIKLDAINRNDAEIVEGKLVLSQLMPALQSGLSTFELMSGQSLPRKGNDIILEMSGPVSRPKIKGFRY